MLISKTGYSAFTSIQVSPNNITSHNMWTQGANLNPIFSCLGLLAHTWISSIHRHTHICTFLGINICSKTAKYSSSDPRLSPSFSPKTRAQFEKMWVSFHSLASPASAVNHVASRHREHKVKIHSKNHRNLTRRENNNLDEVTAVERQHTLTAACWNCTNSFYPSISTPLSQIC